MDLLLEDLVLDAEDEVLERTGDHVVGAEQLVYGVYELIVVLEQVGHLHF